MRGATASESVYGEVDSRQGVDSQNGVNREVTVRQGSWEDVCNGSLSFVFWQRSHQLALNIYEQTRAFPPEERFGIISQVRRAAVSVASNIAEGAKRRSNRGYARLLNIAEGSLPETESLLRLAKDLGFGRSELLKTLIAEADEISRMVYALRASVEADAERQKL